MLKICAFAFSVNIILAFVKLYVGLSSNSISIFSDSINNMLDSLSGCISFIFLFEIGKKSLKQPISTLQKSEQLLSFIISLTVVFSAFYFAYSCVERLMYPTPIWYQVKYLILILITAFIKLIMFFFYRNREKKITSPIVTVLKTDSILDFFISLVTVISLTLSQWLSFTFDSIFGIIISVIIFVGAIRLIVDNVKLLINYKSFEKTKLMEDILSKTDGVENFSLSGYFSQSKTQLSECCEIQFSDNIDEKEKAEIIEEIKSRTLSEAGIKLNIIR